MRRLWDFLIEPRTLTVIGFAALAAFLLVGASTLKVAAGWALAALALALLLWLLVWAVRRRRARRAADELGGMLSAQAETARRRAPAAKRPEIEALRVRMDEAVRAIKNSRLGQTTGRAALYELPWYMIIGNPAAGKSSAILHSGLTFPFADKTGAAVQGVGGTRNCDWFFTSDGILLDTAGRYSVHEEDRNEWTGFLDLLKKHRSRAPINGILIAVSIPDLTANRPESVINLAKNLRQRVQEVVERLEVFAPVYVVFTKVDLIAGFTEFFQDADRLERDRVWGVTLPYEVDGKLDPLAHFDARFDELYDGLKEMSLAGMAMNRATRMPPGLLTFPLEFAGLKPALRAFLATLFEENPFQFKPIFRGFYFTSALQEGASIQSSSDRIAQRFGLQAAPKQEAPVSSAHGFFLFDLFRKVIFADRNLVRQYTSVGKTRMRFVTFLSVVAALGLVLGAWSWSYLGNRQLVGDTRADLDKAVRLQQNRTDLQSRLQALDILQERLGQLTSYRESHPLSPGFGLYQGDALEKKLRDEYYAGVGVVMLKPVATNLEAYLRSVNENADKLAARAPGAASGSTPAPAPASPRRPAGLYDSPDPTSPEDAYNALKAYLMLSARERAEETHLQDQLTRFWRTWIETNRGGMPREEATRRVEKIIAFYTRRIADPSWPVIDPNRTLVEQTRATLVPVLHGMAAIDRVYGDIKQRATASVPAITVASIVGEQDKALVVGSAKVPGAFTRRGWEQQVNPAIKDAATNALQSADWVLLTSGRDDLTLSGSPQEIQKTLVTKYKLEYAANWRRFLEGVQIADFGTSGNFETAVGAMNRLGDPETSPLGKLMDTVYRETSWDNPSLIDDGLRRAQGGVMQWFRETILRQAPQGVNINIGTPQQSDAPKVRFGVLGKEFDGVARLIVASGNETPLMRTYLNALSKIRGRFNQIKNAADPGPGALKMTQQTYEQSGSELDDARKLVEEQLVVGISEAQKKALAPTLKNPLIQALNALLRPAENELNKIWNAKIYEPFRQKLADKYPFVTTAKSVAPNNDRALIFGPDGAIAAFAKNDLGAIVVQRGDTLTARAWGPVSLRLTPELTQNYAYWVSTESVGGARTSSGGDAAAPAGGAQIKFELKPQRSPGVAEYTLDIGGKQLVYRNTLPTWELFTVSGTDFVPARITAKTNDGKTVEVVRADAMQQLADQAATRKVGGGVIELTWTKDDVSVIVLSRPLEDPIAQTERGAVSRRNLNGVQLPSYVVGERAPGVGANAMNAANAASVPDRAPAPVSAASP